MIIFLKLRRVKYRAKCFINHYVPTGKWLHNTNYQGEEEGTSIVYTDPNETGAMFDAVKAMGLAEGASMSLSYVSKAPVECSEEDFEKNMAIIDALEELDDVDSVEHNMSN